MKEAESGVGWFAVPSVERCGGTGEMRRCYCIRVGIIVGGDASRFGKWKDLYFHLFLGVGEGFPVLGLPRPWTAVLGLGIWE